MADMCRAALAGDAGQAHDINNRLMPLHQTLFCEPSPIPVKWACARLGLMATATLRLPLTDLTPEGSGDGASTDDCGVDGECLKQMEREMQCAWY